MTNLPKIWELPGGIHPPENKVQSTQLPLGNVPLPPELIIPLNQHLGTPARPIIQVGAQVLAGQLIGAAEGTFSANTHASTSGRVVAIGEYAIPHPSGMTSEAVVIAPDGHHQWMATEICENFRDLSPLDLIDKIRAGGIAGLGGAGFPTSVKLSPKSTQPIDTLIINGAECEPYITADDILMQVRADQVVAGILLLSHILHNPRQLLIGIEDNKPQAIAALQAAITTAMKTETEAAAIKIVSFPTKYPSGGAKQLIQILTGREIPSGHHSADIGVICVNVGTTVAAWRAVHFGEPLVSRVMTVVGEALSVQRNIDVLIGTPIDYVLAQHGFAPERAARVIMGGPMMGFTLPSLKVPVIKTTNCLLVPTRQELPLPPPAQACIRCGMCAEVCPASLLPQQLFWYAQAEDHERLQAHNLFDCIECGACSYVCPSSIPLVQYYRAAKGTIRQHDREKEKADRSRQRFEFRQARIAKEEAEKEAKRLARQQAAEEAKKQLAARPPTGAMPPLMQAAASVSLMTSHLTPTEQKAKLERAVEAARNSLASANVPLVPRNADIPITPEQLVQQQARVKQAELRVADAEKKLTDFMANQASGSPEDPMLEALKRAQNKLNQSPAEKLEADLHSLRARLAKAREKADLAEQEGRVTASALRTGVEKLEQKIVETEQALIQITGPKVH